MNNNYFANEETHEAIMESQRRQMSEKEKMISEVCKVCRRVCWIENMAYKKYDGGGETADIEGYVCPDCVNKIEGRSE